jgi:O-antigen ligase
MKGLIFTYILTYGGALVSLFNPFLGLLVYVCFAIVKPEETWHWSVPQGNYSRIVALALLIGWALKGFGNWQLGRARAIAFALVAFWLWSIISAALAPDQNEAWHFVETLSKVVLPFLVGITTIRSLRQVRQLAWVIVLSQGYLAYELNLEFYLGYNRLWYDLFGSMDNNCNAIALVTCLGLAFFLGMHARAWWLRALALGTSLLMAHAILFSFSRGGMLALLITGAITVVLMPKRPTHLLIFGIAALLVWRLAGADVVARFQTIFVERENLDGSAASRLELWAACWDIMSHHPLGIGPHHWPLVAHEYGFTPGKEAHTLWLQVGAELGFPGLISLVMFYGLCVARLWPLVRRSQAIRDPWFSYFASMVIASLVGFAVSAQFVSLVGLEQPYYVALIGAGVLKLVPGTDRVASGSGAQPNRS